MSCLQNQSDYSNLKNSINYLSSSNDDETRDSSLNDENGFLNDVGFRLRNSLRSHNRNLRNETANKSSNQQTTINSNCSQSGILKQFGNSSLFDQLIREAKNKPISDFESVFESSSYFNENIDYKSPSSKHYQNDSSSSTNQQNCAIDYLINNNESSIKKVNRRKNQIELIDDFDDDDDVDSDEIFELDYNPLSSFENREQINGQLSNLKTIQSDSSLKELRNFKNLNKSNNRSSVSNGLNKSRSITNFKSTKSRTHHSTTNRNQIKPIQQRLPIDNLYNYNDDFQMNVDEIEHHHQSNTSKRFLLKKHNQQYIFERINDHGLTSSESSHDTSSETNHYSRNRSRLMTNFKLKPESIQSNCINGVLSDQELLDKCLLKSSNKSTIFEFYAFQDEISPNLDRDDCQTSVIVLIQLDQISIWTKREPSQIEWTSNFMKLDNQQVFRCIKIERDHCFCILFLVYSYSLVSLKYCLIDKQTKTVQLVHAETFEVFDDLNLIHLCFISPCFIALSIPRVDDNIIDVLIYDQFNFETKFNKSKRIIYMLNNLNNKFSSSTNCFLVSDELDNTFLAIFNQKLFLCNVNEQNRLPKMISVHKYVNSNYLFFDVLYDKGIYYLFAGNYLNNRVRIIALNIDRCVAERLIKYDIEKSLKENQPNNLDDDDFNNRGVRLLKRKGDHLLIIKNDNRIALFNLFSDEIVYQTKLSNVDQIAIAILNRKTTILAVLNNQNIINLIDL